MQATVSERRDLEEASLHDSRTYRIDTTGYTWKQTQEELEMSFDGHQLSAAEAKTANVVIKSKHLTIKLKNKTVFDDDLWEAVRPEESTWSVSDGLLTLNLQKVPLDPPTRNNWPRCGKSEPHKYEKEYKAKMFQNETQSKLGKDLAMPTKEAAPPQPTHEQQQQQEQRRHQQQSEQVAVNESNQDDDDMPELEDYIPDPDDHKGSASENTPCSVSQEGAADATKTHRKVVPKKFPSADISSDSASSSEDELSDRRTAQARRNTATTGTLAERERLRQQKAREQSQIWNKGTAVESWTQKGQHPRYMGPISAAESWRRGETAGPSS